MEYILIINGQIIDTFNFLGCIPFTCGSFSGVTLFGSVVTIEFNGIGTIQHTGQIDLKLDDLHNICREVGVKIPRRFFKQTVEYILKNTLNENYYTNVPNHNSITFREVKWNMTLLGQLLT